jgi:hypothetical protein
MSDVPSNLIPTRITQLPVAPVADENSLMMIVYQGNNYQIRVGDLLSVAGVPTSTQVIAGTGMTGGGALTGNVTLSIANGGVGSTQLAASGVTSGVYGNATNIPVFTVDSTGRVTAATTIPATISGYVPTNTQVIAGNGLSGGGLLSGDVTLSASYSGTAPQAGFQTGSAGASNNLARSDHKHPAVDLSSDDQVDNILGLNNGGTARSLVPAAGAIVWSGADGLYIGPVGIAGQVLVSGGAGAPTWGSALLVLDQPANVVYAGPAAGADAPTTFRALVNADLPASGVTANTYGSTTAIPVLTVNSKGVITSATTASITGALVYQGAWNALTNTPTLTSSVGVSGYYYVVSVAGTTNLNGITDWQIGDWAIFNGTVWQKIDQTNLVSSVNGQTGVVVLTQTDIAGTASLTTTQTLTNKTLTSPSINEILDANGNEILSLSPVASATDYLTVKNGIGVGVPLHLQADGSSSNIGLHIQPKGTGLVTITDGTDFNKGIRFRSSGSVASAVTLIDAVSSAGHVVTLPDATTTLVGRNTTDTLTNKTIAFSSNTFSGTLPITNGGTGQATASAAFNALSPVTTAGDLIIGDGANSSTRLAIGANGYLLTSNGTTASWVAAPATGVTSFAGGTTGLTPATATTGAVTLAGTLALANGGSGQTTAQLGMNAFAGAVTSGSYLRGNGTNVVMSTIQVADVPTLNQNTTGTAAGLSATLAIASGGTGQTTAAAAITALTGTQTSAYYLRSNGTNATLSALSAADLTGTVAIASGGTGQTTASAAFNALSPITTTGDLILGNGTNSATRLAIGANGYLLSSNGTTASWQPAPAGGVTTFAGGTTGLTPASATTGAITLAGTLALANGGSGQTTAQAAMNAFAGAVTSGSYLRGNGTNVVMNTIQVADVPTLNQNTTGTAANVTGIVAIANGGTNSTATATAGGAGYGTGTAHAYTAAGTAGQVLTSAGSSAPTWSGISGGTF